MDGKNRAASSYLSPGNPPADKEQNDPLAQVFHNACSYNFFAMAELLHRLAKGEKGTPELSLRDDPAQETLRFSADASLAFPCSDISALKRDTSGAFRMTTTFMGLQGSWKAGGRRAVYSHSREMSAMAPNATGRYRIVSRAFRPRLLPLSCTMAHFVCARRRHNCG